MVRLGLAAGLTQTEIATRLGCTPKTVQTTIKAARRLHGPGWPYLDLVPVSERVEAAAAAAAPEVRDVTPADALRVALSTLVSVAGDLDERAAVRVAAATALIRSTSSLPPEPASPQPVADLLAEIDRLTVDAEP